MKLTAQSPKSAFSEVLQKYKPVDTDFDKFKLGLQTFIDKTDVSQSEEHLKNNLRDFLREAFYQPEYEINTKGKQDLAIHLGKTIDKNVGVIFETKKPSNTAEMITADNPNRRALHELVYYYFEERIEAKNFELKNLVVTDFQKWFVFDANAFDKFFYNSTEIRKLYENTVREDKNKPFFYAELSKILNNKSDEIPCAYFDLSASANPIEIYKILSPAFLLKAEITDDSNALKKPFYYELLHIIGLEETKDKGKVKISRKERERRDAGSLIEQTIAMLESKNRLPKVQNLENYGANYQEQLFSVALELCLTWINRILFLKLLEAQLINYHRGDNRYRFLNIEFVRDFDELFTLFHDVLAVKEEDRRANIKDKFARVPYLNSSLFEISSLEDLTLTVESLKDTEKLAFAANTALKELKAKNQTLNTLEYLFRFLDRHDFASVEKDEELRDAERPLINASVLGKVFEKINGYKDGSIYTPGFITMYMCRQAIRAAVVQKFNDAYTDWHVETFAGLKNKLAKYDEPHKIREFNETLNVIKICDPAVGSGHFLVSALNEIIAVKYELGLLADASGNRFYDYHVSIVNDELYITDRDNKPFKYEITDGKPNPKAHIFQKTLFHEKQTIIENCLFGVDINPNSVKICRLRLWIELLKNAYYKESASTASSNDKSAASSTIRSVPPASAGGTTPHSNTPYTELETLPNIDINIKEGNSLISRFALDDDLKEALKTKNNVKDYREKVFQYKNERRRDVKNQLVEVINNIKSDYKIKLNHLSEERKNLADLNNKLFEQESKQFLFGEEETAREKRLKLIEDYKRQIVKQQDKIKSKEENAIYKNAFEWRFEFPEVLDDEGNFQGFDIVIGNPPYIRQEELGDLKNQLKKDYTVFAGTADILVYFYERGLRVLKQNGAFSFITSNKFMRAGYGKNLREFLWQFNLNEIIDFGELPVFDEAATFPVIIDLTKGENKESVRFTQIKTLKFDSLETVIKETSSNLSSAAFAGENWTLADSAILNLIEKVKKNGVLLKDYLKSCEIKRGVVTGFNEAFVISEEKKNELIAKDAKSAEVIKPFAIGDEIRKWQIKPTKSWLIYIPWHFPLHAQKIEGASTEAEDEFRRHYPAIYEHLERYKPDLIKRNLAETGVRYEWYALQRFGSSYWQDFEKTKIIYPVIAKEPRFAYSEKNFYINDKCFFIAQPDLYLLGYLNSKVAWFYLKNICSVLGDADKGGRLELRSIYVQTLPIPEISPEAQKPFVEIVDEILARKKAGEATEMLEDRIDEMVFELYGLTAEERAIVCGNEAAIRG